MDRRLTRTEIIATIGVGELRRRAIEALSYDPATGIFRWKIGRTGKAKAGSMAGNVNNTGHIRICLCDRLWQAHHLAWLIVYGELPGDGKEIDHFNRIRTDNRIANLRLCSRSQNMANRKTTSRTGFRGVYETCGRFRASIRINDKSNHLGQFATPEEAARAYDIAAVRAFGQFARLNFPREIISNAR